MSYLPCLGDPSTPVIFPASVRHHLEVCKAQSQFPITVVSPLYDKSVIKDVQLYIRTAENIFGQNAQTPQRTLGQNVSLSWPF